MNERDAGGGLRDADRLERGEGTGERRDDADRERVPVAAAATDANATGGSTPSHDVEEHAGQEMSRREAMGMLAMLPLGLALPWGSGPTGAGAVIAAPPAASRIPHPAPPRFFTPHEFDTVRVLVDLIIPRDERSGSATDAGVPEFIDFMMTDRPNMQTEVRGGLAWMDAECMRRCGKTFVDCTDAERRALLDDIAWPKKARPEMSQGVAFFNRIRDLTASGFWSSKMGVEDLQYRGNTYVREWTGCPPEALEKLGVHY